MHKISIKSLALWVSLFITIENHNAKFRQQLDPLGTISTPEIMLKHIVILISYSHSFSKFFFPKICFRFLPAGDG